MHQEIRQLERVAKLHRGVRLLDTGSPGRQQDLLRAWRAFPQHQGSQRPQLYRQAEGDPTGRGDVRHSVVRPRPDRRVVGVGTRRGVHLRAGHGVAILPQQRTFIDCEGASAGHGGVQVHVQRETGDCVVGSQLLLQVREHRVDHGVGREPAEVL